jgi:serine/threonine protein phosphatase PrpC
MDESMLEEELAQRCGSTATLVMLAGGSVHCANVGDSYAVLCRSGQPRVLTTAHRPDLPSEALRVHAAGGIVRQVRALPPIQRCQKCES